jgi:hypothetical protein
MAPGAGNGSPYVRARTIGGLLLLGTVVGLFLLDALLPDFAVDSIQLGLVLGTALVLLGVDAGRKLLGGG